MYKKFLNNSRHKICIIVKNCVLSFDKSFCFSKEELQEIKERVDSTYSDAEQFTKAKKMLPKIHSLINENKESLEANQAFIGFLESKITDIFYADITGDNEKKFELYNSLGLTVGKLNK